MTVTRRGLVWVMGAAGVTTAISAAPGLWRRAFPPEIETEPVPGLPGFCRVPRPGPALLPLIGLTAEPPPPLPEDPCAALFGPAPDRPGAVPVACFTDIRCPWCRRLTPLLIARAARRPAAIRIAWQPLPLLGDGSVLAARAALAAEAQGAALDWQERTMGGALVPTPRGMREIAAGMGLDIAAFERDMAHPRTEARLAEARALAAAFGFVGTPGLVVGRVAILGGVDGPMLDRLIADERAAPGSACG
ncbi:DsbA family protein [Rhodovulum kholense]|uniref:DSBA-like thioredoxin domain-containing protein n=1 Tax=Rhodovulum kholense TaxID=453584 RepID=A0A8E2VJM4_9RHOB|nr:DsbA family protein [Rhodovulum kholense]PTW46128.1 DSBA-like thioredoxin domain-containing protein [Rhodovulum kholense]